MELPSLNLPSTKLTIIRRGDGLKVFDPLRSKYVALTPEEYVRQHFVAWMQTELGFPKAAISNEVSIELNGTLKRCDTVAFDRKGAPLVIVEYKAPYISVSQDTFDQIVRYNMVLRAPYLVVSNGMAHFCCRIDYQTGNYHFIPRLPDYQSLVNPISHN